MSLTRDKFLSDDEVVAFTSLLEKFATSDFRNTTLLMTIFHTGARTSEVLGIRKRDLKKDGMLVFIKGLKNCRDREIPLSPYLFNRLMQLSLNLGEEDRVFPISYHRARDIWAYFRPVKKKIHALRHTRAQMIYQKTKDIRLVQRVLGHTSIETTMIYLDYYYGIEEMRRALL